MENAPRLPDLVALAKRVAAQPEDRSPEMAEAVALAEMCEAEIRRLEGEVAACGVADRSKLAALYTALRAL